MREKNPWTTKGSRVAYDCPWFSVREDQVVRPDGSDGTYSVVQARVACGVVALTEAREVYLVGQYRYPTARYSWEIIEGGAEEGEDPAAAVQRELREEAGLVAERWQRLGADVQLSNCFTDEIGMLWVAEGLSSVEAEPDPTEVLQLKRVPLAEAVAMTEDGRITDSLSLIALARLSTF